MSETAGITEADHLMAEAFEKNNPLMAVKAIKMGFGINEIYNDDIHILWVAAALDSSQLLKTLLENGADVNWRNADSESVMVYCTMGGHLENFELLMEWGFVFDEGEGEELVRYAIMLGQTEFANRLMTYGFTASGMVKPVAIAKLKVE